MKNIDRKMGSFRTWHRASDIYRCSNEKVLTPFTCMNCLRDASSSPAFDVADAEMVPARRMAELFLAET